MKALKMEFPEPLDTEEYYREFAGYDAFIEDLYTDSRYDIAKKIVKTFNQIQELENEYEDKLSKTYEILRIQMGILRIQIGILEEQLREGNEEGELKNGYRRVKLLHRRGKGT